MEPQNKTTNHLNDNLSEDNEVVSSAIKLSPMDLNNIRLDVRHTILTPDYLENIIKNNSSDS